MYDLKTLCFALELAAIMVVELIWELVKEIGIMWLGSSPRLIGKVPEKMES